MKRGLAATLTEGVCAEPSWLWRRRVFFLKHYLEICRKQRKASFFLSQIREVRGVELHLQHGRMCPS